jgi:hypothetical protein
MRIFVYVILMLGFASTQAQLITKKGFDKQDLNLYVDIAPLFFAAPAFTLGGGLEYNRFQLGVLGIRGNKLPNTFKDLVFENAKEVDFDKVLSTEVVFKSYYKKSRKGFYIGGLVNYSQFRAVDKLTSTNKTIQGLNLDAFIGYRWFPFKKYLNIRI